MNRYSFILIFALCFWACSESETEQGNNDNAGQEESDFISTRWVFDSGYSVPDHVQFVGWYTEISLFPNGSMELVPATWDPFGNTVPICERYPERPCVESGNWALIGDSLHLTTDSTSLTFSIVELDQSRLVIRPKYESDVIFHYHAAERETE